MFEEFSASYYIGQLCIEPYDGAHAVMDSDQHVAANEQVYDTGGPIERRDHPLVMKIEQCYVPVFGTDNLARDTLGLPAAVLASTRIDNPPAVKEVLVAKAERAAQLLEWTTPYTIHEPDSHRTTRTGSAGAVRFHVCRQAMLFHSVVLERIEKRSDEVPGLLYRVVTAS